MPKLKTIKSRLTVAPAKYPTLTDSWRAGKTTAQRGYGSKWRTARAEYLREHPLCVMCSEAGRLSAATVVDHKEPHRGNQKLFWSERLWQGLCKHCHDSAKQRIERGSGW